MTNAKTTATWSISLDCDCPKCGEWFDLLGGDSIWPERSEIDPLEHGTTWTKDLEVTCPECGADFVVDLEY